MSLGVTRYLLMSTLQGSSRSVGLGPVPFIENVPKAIPEIRIYAVNLDDALYGLEFFLVRK